MAYGVLVPWLGIELTLPAVEVLSLKHWTTTEVPVMYFMYIRAYMLIPNSQHIHP